MRLWALTKYISGSGSDFKNSSIFKALEKAVGNPLYSWSHMELKKYFGCAEILRKVTQNYLKPFGIPKNHRLSPISQSIPLMLRLSVLLMIR